MHHIYQVERLEAAYMACKRDAAAGVDGQSWASYGEGLQARLADLSDRLARGGYRPQPVKRVYIDKTDGSKRPLGVPALEDKIVKGCGTPARRSELSEAVPQPEGRCRTSLEGGNRGACHGGCSRHYGDSASRMLERGELARPGVHADMITPT
jgi:hypothetical protein